jgi:hypothetical protein
VDKRGVAICKDLSKSLAVFDERRLGVVAWYELIGEGILEG